MIWWVAESSPSPVESSYLVTHILPIHHEILHRLPPPHHRMASPHYLQVHFMSVSSRTTHRIISLHTNGNAVSLAFAQALNLNQTLIPRVIPARPTQGPSRPAAPARPAAPGTVQTANNLNAQAQRLFTAMSTHVFHGEPSNPRFGRHTFSSWTAANKDVGQCNPQTRICQFQVSPP